MWNDVRKWTFMSVIGITIFMIATLVVFCGCQQAPAPSPSEPAETQTGPGATESITITPETATPTPEVSSTPSKPADLAPYTLSKGRRDPFVPFGSGPAEEVAPTPVKPVAEQTPGAQPTMDMPRPVGAPSKGVSNVPVQVTGTFVSGGKNWAIITSSGGGGPSFMVSAGDRVGEYLVKSIDSSKVVLVWSNKEYVIKIQTFGPQGAPKGTVTQGEEPKEKTLPAPEKPKSPQGQPQMMPPPGGPPSSPGGSAPGGGTGEGAKTEK